MRCQLLVDLTAHANGLFQPHSTHASCQLIRPPRLTDPSKIISTACKLGLPLTLMYQAHPFCLHAPPANCLGLAIPVRSQADRSYSYQSYLDTLSRMSLAQKQGAPWPDAPCEWSVGFSWNCNLQASQITAIIRVPLCSSMRIVPIFCAIYINN